MWEVIASEHIAARRFWPALIQPLAQDSDFRISVTDSSQSLQQTVDSAVSSGVNHFVIAGGDGSVHLVVNAILRHEWSSPPTIAIIPLGTGSDFARHFAIPLAPAEAVKLIRGPAYTYQLVDVGMAEGEWGSRYFVNVASIGLTAESVRKAASLRWLGAARYYVALAMTLPFFRRSRTTIQSRGVNRDEKCIATVIANCQYFGGGVRIMPHAKADDGRLDVLTAAVNRLQFLPLLRRLFAGKHIGDRKTWIHQADTFSVHCDPASAVEMDGEYIGKTPVRISVTRNSIRVLCPANGSEQQHTTV